MATILTALSGCGSSRRGRTSSPSATETQAAPPEPTSAIPCEPVATSFDVPDVEKPHPLSDVAAIAVCFRIEEAYQGSIDITIEDLPDVPDAEGPYDYALREELASATEMDDGYFVQIRAIVGYTVERVNANGTVVGTAADQPVTVGVYEVSAREVVRIRGVGDLEGTVRCW